jgi:NAD(P)-dependent dehydrogenase (short-subunit alcohol dehydrogenase family)
VELGLAGKVALVTGAGAGIGAAIARELAAERCTVWIADVDETAARRIANEMTAQGLHAYAIAMNVGEAASVAAAFAAVTARSAVDVLVNNAGVLRTSTVASSSIADWEALSRINVGGIIACSAAALPGMLAQRGGRIVNLSSVSAMKGGGSVGNAFYGASKAAVSALTKGYAREFGPHGITVNAIAPAVTTTPMTAAFLEEPDVQARIAASIPLRRMASTDEIAALVTFLASERAGYINGAVIPIDGGLLTV